MHTPEDDREQWKIDHPNALSPAMVALLAVGVVLCGIIISARWLWGGP